MNQTIHLVRHGKVENPKGVIYGRLPGYHLSELGRRQAEAAAERLAGVEVGTIRSSPLERAQETAGAIAARHGLDVVVDERLTESATTLEGVGRTIQSFLRSPRQWWSLRNPWRPSWGEPFSQIRARMLVAIHDAVDDAGGKDVVVVSHQTPVLVARLALAGRRVPPWLGLTPCSVGSITTLTLDRGRVVASSYFARLRPPDHRR